MRKLHKKAIIEVGFAWIFILLAGVVILGLFTYIGFKQKDFFMTFFNKQLLSDLSAVFASAVVSRNTAAVINVPKATFDFECDSYGINGVTKDLQGRLVFAPQKLKTERFITWSKGWSLGFRATNFLFITSPYVKYYILYNPADEALAQLMYDDLPLQVNKEMIKIGSGNKTKDEHYDRVHILVLNGASVDASVYKSSDFSAYKNKDVIFIYTTQVRQIDSLDDNTFTTEITFKDKLQNTIGMVDQAVIDKSAVYAALISGNQEVFQCMMDKAYTIKAKETIKIYKERTYQLSGLACDTYYASAITELDSMHSILSQGQIQVASLRDSILQMNQINYILERSGCPFIY
jgi:hypothetical protein